MPPILQGKCHYQLSSCWWCMFTVKAMLQLLLANFFEVWLTLHYTAGAREHLTFTCCRASRLQLSARASTFDSVAHNHNSDFRIFSEILLDKRHGLRDCAVIRLILKSENIFFEFCFFKNHKLRTSFLWLLLSFSSFASLKITNFKRLFSDYYFLISMCLLVLNFHVDKIYAASLIAPSSLVPTLRYVVWQSLLFAVIVLWTLHSAIEFFVLLYDALVELVEL